MGSATLQTSRLLFKFFRRDDRDHKRIGLKRYLVPFGAFWQNISPNNMLKLNNTGIELHEYLYLGDVMNMTNSPEM